MLGLALYIFEKDPHLFVYDITGRTFRHPETTRHRIVIDLDHLCPYEINRRRVTSDNK